MRDAGMTLAFEGLSHRIDARRRDDIGLRSRVDGVSWAKRNADPCSTRVLRNVQRIENADGGVSRAVPISQVREISIDPLGTGNRLDNRVRLNLVPVFVLHSEEGLVASVVNLGQNHRAIQLRAVLVPLHGWG